MKKALLIPLIFLLGGAESSCDESSDSKQRDMQEKILAEGTAQTGMPAIKNFRERKLVKDLLEMRDQNGLVTYTYLENMMPAVVHGYTALGGKLTYLGQTVGYGIPYAMQYTNPQKSYNSDYALPQADPNGLFSPSSAEGTWVFFNDPNGGGKTLPLYVESRIISSPFKFKMD